ncbi:MAG: MarR family transcriptional regulator [Bacteroidales bacterium]|nr:MarR family transcriptional regulator [Bacteroidales bacterium]MCR5139004.1 MarR family transcriptional regulator [Bacteroidaceae bacterium]
MVISKQLGVFLNYVHNRFKLTVNSALEEAGFDITAEQFLLLDTLWTEGPLAQQRIADFMLKDKNSVVKLVDSLESKHWVKRRTNPVDKRQNIVCTTPKADKAREGVTNVALQAVTEITQGLTEEEISTFIKVMDRMSRNMEDKTDLLEVARKFPLRKLEA